MVEIKDIKDQKSLRKWLEGRSREEAVWIASRAAMRALPLFWEWTFSDRARKDDLTALPVLRCLLISSVAAVRPTEDIKAAARAAADAAAAAARAAAAFWNATRTDCGHIVSGRLETPPELWPRSDDAPVFNWPHVKSTATEPEWSFWIKWYQDALDGVKPDWDLLERIALKIDKAIWDAGPKAMADAIRDIRSEFAAKATPNAEVIVENPETGKLRVEAASLLGADGLGDIQEKMREAADVFEGQGGPNGPYAALEPEIEMIRRTAALKSPRPIRLYDASRRAARRTRKRVENGESPHNDPLVEDFVDQLEETALDLLRLNEDVRDAVTSRAQAKIDDKPEEVAANLEPAIEELVEISEGELAEELPQDVAIAGDPTQTPEARKTAIYIIASRVTRIYRGARKALSEAHEISKDAAGLSKNIAIIVASSAAIQTAINWLLSLF